MPTQTDSLRLAVLSTPRCGNTWLRGMLAELLDLEQGAIHRPQDLDWPGLPERAVIQLHWMPEPSLLALLREHRFRVLVLARHPLDVLISILAFCQHDDSTPHWLDGRGGDERSLIDQSPVSEAFLEYAVGPRALALLAVSQSWWHMPGVCRVRYEDLVSDAPRQLQRILGELGEPARKNLAEVVARSKPREMRATAVDMVYHIWQARPGLWKRLFAAREAQRISAAHQASITAFGYACEPDETLTPIDVQRAWEQFNFTAVRQNIHGLKRELREIAAREQQNLAGVRAAVADAHRQLKDAKHELAKMEQARAAAQLDLQACLEQYHAQLSGLTKQFAGLPHEQIRQLAELGPWSMRVARGFHTSALRFPRMASATKSLIRWVGRALFPRPGGLANERQS